MLRRSRCALHRRICIALLAAVFAAPTTAARAAFSLTTLAAFPGPSNRGPSAFGGFGTLFEITPGSDHLTTLVQFSGPNGRQPLGGLIADAAGNLYGTTHQGGSTFVPQVSVGFGTIFKYSPATNTFTTL